MGPSAMHISRRARRTPDEARYTDMADTATAYEILWQQQQQVGIEAHPHRGRRGTTALHHR